MKRKHLKDVLKKKKSMWFSSPLNLKCETSQETSPGGKTAPSQGFLPFFPFQLMLLFCRK